MSTHILIVANVRFGCFDWLNVVGKARWMELINVGIFLDIQIHYGCNIYMDQTSF